MPFSFRCLPAVLSVLLCLASGTVQDRSQAEGLAVCDRGDHATARQAGHAPAMNVPVSHDETANRPEDALRRLEKSAAKHDPESQYRLAGILLSREKIPPETAKRALELTMASAGSGYPPAQFALAKHYRYGTLTDPDAEKALMWYHMSAARQYVPALTELANIYENGLMDQPVDKALSGQLRARIGQIRGIPAPEPPGRLADTIETVRDGIWPFCFTLPFIIAGLFRMRARYRARQIESGVRLFKSGQYDTAARFLDKKYVPAFTAGAAAYGEMLALGLGVEKNVAKAMPYLTIASPKDGRAAFLTGTLFENGDGVPQNAREAVYWYERAAGLDNTDAMTRLGMLHALGQGTARHDGKAFEWLQKAAANDHIAATAALAVLHHLGRGTEKDEATAYRLTRKAAAQDQPAALYNLAVSCRHGFGTPVDGTRADRLFRQSAERGCRQAMLALAAMHETHSPETCSSEEAAFWRGKAAQTPARPPSESVLLYPETDMDGLQAG